MKNLMKRFKEPIDNKLFAININNAIGTFAPMENFERTLEDIECVINTPPKKMKDETIDSFNSRYYEHTKVVDELKKGKVVIVKVVQQEVLTIKDILQLGE